MDTLASFAQQHMAFSAGGMHVPGAHGLHGHSDSSGSDSWEDDGTAQFMHTGAAHALVELLIKRRESLSEGLTALNPTPVAMTPSAAITTASGLPPLESPKRTVATATRRRSRGGRRASSAATAEVLLAAASSAPMHGLLEEEGAGDPSLGEAQGEEESSAGGSGPESPASSSQSLLPRKRRPQICQRCGQLRKGHKCPLAKEKKSGPPNPRQRSRSSKRKVYVLGDEGVLTKENQPPEGVDPIADFLSRVSTTFHIPMPALQTLFFEYVGRYDPAGQALPRELEARLNTTGAGSDASSSGAPAGEYVMSVLQHMVRKGQLTLGREQDCTRLPARKVLRRGDGAELWACRSDPIAPPSVMDTAPHPVASTVTDTGLVSP